MISFRPLAAYLAYHRITHKELAQKTGLTQTTVNTGFKDNYFSPRSVNLICQSLNIGIKNVMRYEDSEQTPEETFARFQN